MNYAAIIKEIGRGKDGARDLCVEDAEHLFGAMLDGGVPDLELGAILIALRVKAESDVEMQGFYRALDARLNKLDAASGAVRPVVLPSYNGARHQANLTPLLALLLKRLGVPVLMHGPLDSHGRVATPYILRELGILPAASLAKAEQHLQSERLVYVPTQLIAPGLANLLALRSRLGVRGAGHSLVKMIDPVVGGSLRVVSVSHPDYLDKMRQFFVEQPGKTLLLRGTEGEPFANPKRRPQLELFDEGRRDVLFEAEIGPIATLPSLAAAIDPATTARWIEAVLDGQIPLPLPLANQLACCLYGAGYADSLARAKAIVAVEIGALLHA